MNFGELSETGIAIGMVGSTLSMISEEPLKIKLGYSSMSVKNFIKVSITSGATSLAVVYGFDKIKRELDK